MKKSIIVVTLPFAHLKKKKIMLKVTQTYLSGISHYIKKYTYLRQKVFLEKKK